MFLFSNYSYLVMVMINLWFVSFVLGFVFT